MGRAIGATTDSITNSDDSFPNDEFFPDIGNLFLDDMGDNVNANADVNTNAGALMLHVYFYLCFSSHVFPAVYFA